MRIRRRILRPVKPWYKVDCLFPFIDSTVLAYVLKLLNERYDYGLNLILLSVDEGITGYRDDSLEVFYLRPPIGLDKHNF